jgi:hypothetical protein
MDGQLAFGGKGRPIGSVSIFEQGRGKVATKVDAGSISVATFSFLLFLLFIYCDEGKLLPERLRWMQGGLGRAVFLAQVWAESSRL